MPRTTPTTQLSRGDTFGDRYEVVRLIGRGGMGAVYEVVDRNTHRHRALKVMRADVTSDAALRKRFRREATVSARIHSDHIAEVLDAAVDDASGQPYIVLELLVGQELAAMVTARGALPVDEVLGYLSQTAMALHKAHAADVVHRDLKPENLFVTYRDDGSPHVKLLDFGVAKVVAGAALESLTVGMVGTPIYMAPEQMSGGHPICPQTDLLALAHIAYTVLVGEPYWKPEQRAAGSDPFALMVAMRNGIQEPATTRAGRRRQVTLPAAFDAWFDCAMQLDPRRRFEGAVAMIEDLREALGAVSAPLESEPAHGLSGPPPVASDGIDTVDRIHMKSPAQRPEDRAGHKPREEVEAVVVDGGSTTLVSAGIGASQGEAEPGSS